MLGAGMLFGVSNAFAGYLRFFAAALTPKCHRARAVSITIGAAVVSGFLGPLLARVTAGALHARFTGAYLSAGAMLLLSGAVILTTPHLTPAAARPSPVH